MGDAATHPHQLNHSQYQISTPRRGRTRYNPFPRGSKVEVRTDDEGFTGVYFTANVLRSTALSPKKTLKRRSRSLYVEYDDLLAHDGGPERLKEHVELSCCRPAPPPISVSKPFEPDDVVDAFYRDGWWPGVVTRVIEGGERYVVTFSCPPDELEFGFSDLRVHSDWVNGNWIRPQKQRIAGLMFCVGRKVEVSFDTENCRDAWFPGTIHEDLGNGAFLVEYSSASFESVKVTVKTPHIRPCPPCLKNRNFDLLEKVDAFFDYSWWAGVVTKEHENGRYTVFFKQIKRKKDFNQSELRPHTEWMDGKWFTSSQGVPILSLDIGMHEHHKLDNPSAIAVTIPLDCLDGRNDSCDHVTPSSLTIGKDHSEQIIPEKQKMSHVVTCLTKGGKHASVSQNALSQPTEKDEADVDRSRERDTLDISIKDSIYSSVSTISVTKKPSSASRTDTSWGKRIRRSQNGNCTPSSVNGTSVQTSELELYPNLNGGLKDFMIAALKFAYSVTNSYLLMSSFPAMELDAVGSVAAVQNEHAKNNTEPHVVLGLPCAEIGNLECATKVKGAGLANSKETKYLANDKKRQLTDSTAHKIKDNKILESEEQPERRKRGRPKKIPLDGIHSPVTGNAQDKVVCSGDLTGTSEDSHRIPEVEEASSNPDITIKNNKSNDGSLDPKNENGRKRKRIPSKMHSEEAVEESVRLQGSRSSRRGRRLLVGDALQVSVDESVGKMKEVNKAMEIDKQVCEAPNKNFDDEPLSKWIEGIQSPPSSNVSKPSAATNVNQCMENGKKKGDIVVHTDTGAKQPESGENTLVPVVTASIVPSEPENLPFVKNTFLWQTIESMEVFWRMPQRPHFKPLEDFAESSREGLAIGYMVTFSSVVDRTSRLQHDDPESVIDDIMRTLTDLERHGFDVKAVRDCITECLKLRKLQNQRVDEVKMLKDQTLEHKQEFSGLEEELKQLQEKIALAEATKERVSGEILSLEAEIAGREEMVKILDSDFQTITSSLLQ